MTIRYSRDDLLRQLQDALDVAGANPARWPENARARLSALVESDEEAARMLAKARALDKVLSRAPGGSPRSDLELRILAAASSLPQQGSGGGSSVISLDRARRQRSMLLFSENASRPSFWGGAALLAASLILGVFIGLSGGGLSTLRDIELLALNDSDVGISFSGSLFVPGSSGEQGRL
jgi:hypothetical protein